MNAKHLYDSADGLVLKSLRGAVALNPGIILHEHSKIVYIDTHSRHKLVAVISGGGSGHEPAHAGYTGKGMLAACVAGDIFASPSAKQILKGIELASSSRPRARSGEFQSHVDSSITGERAVKNKLDVLAIINNYTGDILNFGLAIEKARASIPGVRIESVVVTDDVSLLPQNRNRTYASAHRNEANNGGDGPPTERQNAPERETTNKLIGPRGLGANILVCKILGALAERGASLEVVKAMGDAVVGNLYSVGVGLEHCHVPGHGRGKNGALGERECEVGLGLHNEPGVHRREIGAPAELISEMVKMLFRSGGRGSEVEDYEEGASAADDEEKRLTDECREGMVLFINNLGGMSQLEMGAVVDDVLQRFETDSIRPKRVYCSSYMTSLNAPGFSISILSLTGTMNAFRSTPDDWIPSKESEVTVEELLDMPTDAYAWVGARSSRPAHGTGNTESSYSNQGPDHTPLRGINDLESFAQTRNIFFGHTQTTAGSKTGIHNAVKGACLKVIDIHGQLTEFDTIVGDGDCGDTFKAGATAILNSLENEPLGRQTDVDAMIYGIAEIIEDTMGGTIGALLAIFFHALSVSVAQHRPQGSSLEIPWGKALQYAKETLSRYTPAEIGDRTIIDALGPFCTTMAQTSTGSTIPVQPKDGGNDDTINETKPTQVEKTHESVLATFSEAVKQARIGAERTRGMTAHLGRAAYIGSIGSPTSSTAGVVDLPPDPGAWGICAILEGFLDGLTKSSLKV